MEVAITQEHALLRAKLKLVCVEWTKIRPTRTTKGTKTTTIKFFMKEPLKRRREIKEFGW
jgi:hypothetical protein